MNESELIRWIKEHPDDPKVIIARLEVRIGELEARVKALENASNETE